MMNLQKIKEALSVLYGWTLAQAEHCGGNMPDDCIIDLVNEAEAEFEKPADIDAYNIALKVLSMEQGRNSAADYATVIQQYAEAYHQRKCAECGK